MRVCRSHRFRPHGRYDPVEYGQPSADARAATVQQQAWPRRGLHRNNPVDSPLDAGGVLQIWPPLGEDENLEFWYQSKYWILATAATAVSKELFTVDTDTCIFPDPLMRSLIA